MKKFSIKETDWYMESIVLVHYFGKYGHPKWDYTRIMPKTACLGSPERVNREKILNEKVREINEKLSKVREKSGKNEIVLQMSQKILA